PAADATCTLSLPDALPIWREFLGAATLGTGAILAGGASSISAQPAGPAPQVDFPEDPRAFGGGPAGTNIRAEIDLFDCEVEGRLDRKSTRLNSSHVKISYA